MPWMFVERFGFEKSQELSRFRKVQTSKGAEMIWKEMLRVLAVFRAR